MGKSTVLTHLSKEIKERFPHKWVVRIDLNDHTDALNALKQEQIDKEKVIEFVSEKVLKLKPGLELELFKQCCEQNHKVRIVIMLDGFDEISPSYKQTVIDLLQALRQTAVEQLWVTTRPHLREELEDKLQQLSYTLEPFSEDEQIEFLTKFWIQIDCFTNMDNKDKAEIKKKLKIYAEKLIINLKNSISDQDAEFTSIPLQCHMLAVAFDKEVKLFCESAESTPNLPFKLGILELYGRFIERKYDIYQEEKLQVQKSNVAAIQQRERELSQLRKDYQLLALKALFTEEQVTLFQTNTDTTFPTEDLIRVGIVQVSDDGKLHFIHRTFAEYYVADCLMNRLTGGDNSSEQVQTFILKDIFLKDSYRVIRAFIDSFLSKSNPSDEVLKQCGKRIHDLGNGCNLILHQAVVECNANIVAVLLDSLQAAQHTDTFVQLLLAKRHTTPFVQLSKSQNAWFKAIQKGNIEVIKKLWQLANEKLRTEEIKNNFFLARDYLNRTVLHTAAEQDKLEILQKVWEWANGKLTKEEIKNKLLLASDRVGRTVFHMAAQQGELEMLDKLRDWANEKLTTEEIDNILLLATNTEGRTIFHIAAKGGSPEILQKVWEWANEKLTKEEINNKLLLATDKEGRTVFHTAAERGTLQILQKVWEGANEKLTTEEINNKILLATDGEGRTVFHTAAERGTLEILQKVCEWANEKLTKEEINNKILLATDRVGRTVFHTAVNCGRPELLQKVWEWANEKLTTGR
jgi:ankyrin repeat protein